MLYFGSFCMWNFITAPLLNPMVTHSDSVLSDDRPTAIGFCSALCLPGVALVCTVELCLCIHWYIAYSCYNGLNWRLKQQVSTLAFKKFSCLSRSIFQVLDCLEWYIVCLVFLHWSLFPYFCNDFDIKKNSTQKFYLICVRSL